MQIVIVGNSAAGIGAAEAIRKNSKSNNVNVSIISQEPYSAYSRPFLKDFLGSTAKFDRITYRDEDFYKDCNINTIFGKKAVAINPSKKIVTLDNQKNVNYDKLLITTGGKTIIPSIKGLNKKQVFEFMTYDDAKNIKTFIAEKNKSDKRKKITAVVIGGGLIGYSAAVGLSKLGVKVIMIELLPYILNRIFDKNAAEMAQKILNSKGIEIITDNSVVSVNGKGNILNGITLKSGKKVKCELVILAAGVTPNLEICEKTKIKTNRGIIVNEYLNTNIPEIYAAGDVSEAPDGLTDENSVAAIWPTAYKQGRFAGLNMVNDKRKFPGSFIMNSLDLMGTSSISGGLINPPHDDYEVLLYKDEKSLLYKKILIHQNKIVGYIFLNEIDKAGIFYGIMADKVNVKNFKQHLLKKDFGFVYTEQKYRKNLFEKPR